MQLVGRRCCAAGHGGRAAARPYRLLNVPIFIAKWYNLTLGTANDRFFNMKSTMTISKLNQNGSAAVRLARKQGQLAITDHGETVAFILSADRVEGILDTLEILGDGEAMKTIRAYEAGKLPMKDVACLDD